ncbi:MAG: DEAD/DEAH box helicase family protein [Caldilineales bacterium]
MGATDIKAIKALWNCQIPRLVSYDTKRTRLHAKAYLFHRSTGFGSAYIGSANVSKAALDEGLEWTAKISQYETEHLWLHAIASFESHWEDDSEFSPCHEKDLPTLELAIARERGREQSDEAISFFDLRPYGYQQAILEDIAAERASGRQKHLVIAATGTGKTMVAAFDYRVFL